MSATCRTCGTAIVWGVTTAGKRMPLDALPVAGGKWLLGVGNRIIARPSTEPLGHDSHFATCPQAAEHRKRGAA